MSFNRERFYQYLEGFKRYIEAKSGEAFGVLCDNSFFRSQEGYKHTLFENAQNVLSFSDWTVAHIGTGEIAKKARQAVDEGGNLIHHQQKLHFKNKVLANPKLADQLLFNLYCTNDDAKSFEALKDFLGGKYDLLAYLFFIKDKTKYLPINSRNFDERFEFLGVSFQTTRRCAAKNYFDFVHWIDALRINMEKYYGFSICLLDAHSVVWQIGLANEEVGKIEEQNADALLMQSVQALPSPKAPMKYEYSGGVLERAQPILVNGQKVYPRNRYTAYTALRIANNSCEMNPAHESFIRRNSGEKYMEPHHLVPMSQSGKFEVSLDRAENIICLCSNCHNEIHYGANAKQLVEALYTKRKSLLESVGIHITLETLLKFY